MNERGTTVTTIMVAIMIVGFAVMIVDDYFLTESPTPTRMVITTAYEDDLLLELILTATLTSSGNPVEGKFIEWDSLPSMHIRPENGVTDSSGRVQTTLSIGPISNWPSTVTFTASSAGDDQYQAAEDNVTITA